jgi:FkbM family methyltransferase
MGPALLYNVDRLRCSLGRGSGRALRIKPRGVRYPITLRPGPSSDPTVFRQVFLQQQYRMPDADSSVRSILDLGANIGLAAIYYLNRFPESRVLAVEPDPGNYRLCVENLAPYADRARVLLGAVWPHCGRLALSRWSDGREWATTVAEPESEADATVQAWDVPTLMATAGFETVDLLKIDIEGSERVLFEAPCDPWLARVRNLSVELHGKSCEEPFYRALAALDWEVRDVDEVVCCRNVHFP